MRFPEFEDEWRSFSFRNIVQMFSGGTPSMRSLEYWGGDIPFISAASMHDAFISKSDQYITQEGLQNGSKLLKKGNLLLLVRGSMLWNRIPVCYNTIDIAFNQDVKGLVTNDKTSALFMFYWLQSKESILKYKVTGTGIGAGKLDSADILDLLVILPYNAEQSKIEKLLSLIDERVTAQSKIIAQLQTLMQGLGEQLFKQQIQVKDEKGNDFPDWEEKGLGEVGETYNGLSGKSKDNFGRGERYIQYKQIFDSSKIKIEGCGLVDVSESENQNRVQYGDVFFTTSSETPEEIGMSSVLLDAVEDMYLNSFCFGFRPNSLEILNPQFAQYFFRSEIFRSDVITLAQGSTRYNLSKIEFLKLPIKLPCLEEQALIANFLASIDEKIETEKKILQQYESQKKHLLQNMFI
ncbi:MAG: restriction endonuclease subunit S [Agriterribacter sp.]